MLLLVLLLRYLCNYVWRTQLIMNKLVQAVPRQLGTGFNQRCEPYLNTFTSGIFFSNPLNSMKAGATVD